ncbi:MAG: hypothetical protein ACI4SF_10290 [Oscillospiraceae bacterium]
MENSKQGISMAEKRVEEMNRLTQGLLEQSNRYMQQRSRQQNRPQNNFNRGASPPPKPRFETVGKPQQEKTVQPPKQEPPPCEEPKPAPSAVSGINTDTALIVTLAAVLLKENADIKLILALLYILM